MVYYAINNISQEKLSKVRQGVTFLCGRSKKKLGRRVGGYQGVSGHGRTKTGGGGGEVENDVV